MRCPSCGKVAVKAGEACPECGAEAEKRPRTALGLKRNVAATLAYPLTFVTGLAFYAVEDDAFIRFHAAQSVVVIGSLFGLVFVVETALGLLTVAGVAGPAAAAFLAEGSSSALGAIGTVLWLVLMLRAFQGTRFGLPGAGDLADRYA